MKSKDMLNPTETSFEDSGNSLQPFSFSDFKNEDINFINGAKFMQQQHLFPDQLKFFYEFHDPMALWMHWDFKGVSYIAILG